MILQRGGLYGSAALFFFLLLLGGGGSESPLIAALAQAASLAAVGAALASLLFLRHVPRLPLVPGLLIVSALLLVLVQLVPLPFGLWSRLPGRELAAEATRLAGLGPVAMPLSLDPEATRRAALMLLPPIAVFILALFRTPKQRLGGLWLVIGVALFSALLAALQVVRPGASAVYFYPAPGYTAPSGIFANQNHQALFLLLAILALAAVIRSGHGRIPLDAKRSLHVGWLIGAFLVVMVIATGSRFGLLALFPTVLIATALAIRARRAARALGIGASVALASAVTVLLVAPDLVRTVGARFSGTGSDLRSRALPDLFYAIDQYAPFGSGLGTFNPVFRGVESLDIVDTAYLNHAHNDYIELAIETGYAGPALVALFLLLWVWRLWGALRDRSGSTEALQARVAGAMIGLVLLHSAIDYPLRTISHFATFAFACALLFSRGPPDPVKRRVRRKLG